jgi:hypothetical protein
MVTPEQISLQLQLLDSLDAWAVIAGDFGAKKRSSYAGGLQVSMGHTL